MNECRRIEHGTEWSFLVSIFDRKDRLRRDHKERSTYSPPRSLVISSLQSHNRSMRWMNGDHLMVTESILNLPPFFGVKIGTASSTTFCAHIISIDSIRSKQQHRPIAFHQNTNHRATIRQISMCRHCKALFVVITGSERRQIERFQVGLRDCA